MDFFVPNPASGDPLPPNEAEQAWQAARKGAESDLGREATRRGSHGFSPS
jgi:hypothetical protein